MIAYHLGYVALVGVAIAAATAIAILAWRNRETAGAIPLAALMTRVAVWSAAKLLELWTVGLAGTRFWANVQYAGIVVVPAAWLVFGLAYTGRDAWLSRPMIAALAVEPLLVLGVI